jgi:very-short-patch-repair endonuclease
MDPRLETHALAQGGVFAWVDAQRYCVTPRRLAAWVADGSVIRVRRNAYILASAWHRESPDGRNRLRVRAVTASQASWAASHQSALAAHELPLHDVTLGWFDMAAPVSRYREQALVRRHPLRDLPPPVDVEGCRTMPIPYAVAQVALRDGLLPALVALDRALHGERTCLDDIRRAGDRLVHDSEETKVIDRLIALADPLCESVGETLTRVLLLDLGYAPRSQVVIRDTFGHFVGRVDFLIDERLVVEFDGAIKYEGEDAAEVLERQRAREARLVALGYVVVRLSWDQLRDAEVVMARIEAARAALAMAA